MSQRTDTQNAAMHLYFRWLAKALREKDFDFRDLTIEIPATEDLVKNLMWKPVQEAMFDKKSTTTLEKSEVGQIYDVLNRALIDKLGVSVPFPDRMDLEREKNKKMQSL